MAPHSVRWRFTVADYARMGEAGILTEDDRVELIDGEVRAMSPIGPFHVAVVNRLNALLTRRLGDLAIVSVQNPIRLTHHTEPQPDLTVLRRRDDFYAAALPAADDVLLVVEVADSSAAADRAEKIPRYAAAGIPEVWLIDVARATVEQYSRPVAGSYTGRSIVESGATLIAQAIPILQVPVDLIFGEA